MSRRWKRFRELICCAPNENDDRVAYHAAGEGETIQIKLRPSIKTPWETRKTVPKPGHDTPYSTVKLKTQQKLGFLQSLRSNDFQSNYDDIKTGINNMSESKEKQLLQRRLRNIETEMQSIFSEGSAIRRKISGEPIPYKQITEDNKRSAELKKRFNLLILEIRITRAIHYAIIMHNNAERALSDLPPSQRILQPVIHLFSFEKDYAGCFREMQEKLDAFKLQSFELYSELQQISEKLKKIRLPVEIKYNCLQKLQSIRQTLDVDVAECEKFMLFDYWSFDFKDIKEAIALILTAIGNSFRLKMELGNMERLIQNRQPEEESPKDRRRHSEMEAQAYDYLMKRDQEREQEYQARFETGKQPPIVMTPMPTRRKLTQSSSSEPLSTYYNTEERSNADPRSDSF